MNNNKKATIGIKKTTLRCFECETRLQGDDNGHYYCPNCEMEFTSEYDVVKEFLRIYGVTDAYTVSNVTGVAMSKLNYYLRKGMVEIANCSKTFIKCKKCGADIKYGDYCPNCAKVLAPLVAKEKREIDIGELAPVRKQTGNKMYYLDKDEKR